MAFVPFTKEDQPTMANFNAKFLEAILEGKEQALSAGIKIATGSYVGTGKYGASNKNSLTFAFEPKLLIIFEQNDADNGCGATMIYGATHYSTVPRASSGLMLHHSNVVEWSGNTVSWYNRINETNGWDVSNCILYQLNISGSTYRYIAIG